MDRYTAAAGHSFHTASRFPENYRDRIAFVCEPTGKLVSQFEITAKRTGYVSTHPPNDLYSSGGGWSGPDGAVWIADWYKLIIAPNKNSAGYDAKNGEGNAYETPLREDPFGCILRVYPKGSKDDTNPKLVPTDLNSLLASLAHPNLFWRLQAQRLIVESGSPGSPLRKPWAKPSTPPSATFGRWLAAATPPASSSPLQACQPLAEILPPRPIFVPIPDSPAPPSAHGTCVPIRSSAPAPSRSAFPPAGAMAAPPSRSTPSSPPTPEPEPPSPSSRTPATASAAGSAPRTSKTAVVKEPCSTSTVALTAPASAAPKIGRNSASSSIAATSAPASTP